MEFYNKVKSQQDQPDQGELKVSVFTEDGTRPVENALVRISYTGESGQTVEEVRTDSSGQTPTLELKTPPLEYSMEPVEEQPYAEYTIQVQAEGFENTEIAGTQVLPGVVAQQSIKMAFQAEASFERLVIGPHTLFAEYPPKIEEAEIKPVNESGEIVLSRVVIPEYIVVHDGSVNDTTAPDYYERYKDYIKNVASSEIYATWPDDTIRANILAIMSFTLNRVYTEWYRNKGKDFTITSSTAYDHKWIRGRNVFDSISRITDELFENYLSRPNVRQPILTQYCDGRRVQCRNRGWMTQWGSKRLGDQGYSAIEILRYFYGNDMYINVAEEISGIPTFEPSYHLPAIWITESQRERAESLGYTVVDPPSIIATHLMEIIRSHLDELLTRQDVHNLIENVKEANETLVSELVPKLLNVGEIQKVLQNLLAEGISIRDLVTIFETLADYAPTTHDTDVLTEYVRQSLKRAISNQYFNNNETTSVVTLDPNVEQVIMDSVKQTEQGAYLALDPDYTNRLMTSLREETDKLEELGRTPIIITSPIVRMYLKKLTQEQFRNLHVLSYNEIDSDVELQSVGMVTVE